MGSFLRGLWILFFFFLCFGCIRTALQTQQKAHSENVNSPFSIALSREPATVNPLFGGKDGADQIQQWVVETLAVRKEDDGQWQPVIAERWTVEDGGRSFLFKLRDQVQWSDHEPLTVEDVKFSFDRLLDPQFPVLPKRFEFNNIQSAEIVSPREIRFRVKQIHFSNFAVIAGLQILPRHIYADKNKSLQNRDLLVGSGPYLFTGRLPGQSFTFHKNPQWWGRSEKAFAKLFHFQQLTYRITADDSIALEMLRKGELDFVPMALETYLKILDRPASEQSLYQVERVRHDLPGSVSAIAWNLEKPLFQQKEVRWALAHLLDRQMIQDKFYAGFGSLARGPWSWVSEYADPNVKEDNYDPEKAARVLAEAGWRDSDGDHILDKVIDGVKTDLRFSVLTGDSNLERILTVFKEDAKAFGIEIEIRYMGWNPIAKLVKERKFEALDTFIHGGTWDIDPRSRWHSQSAVPEGVNFSYFKNARVDQLIDEAEQTLDPEKRKPLLQEVYRIIAEERPYLFLFNEYDRFYAHSQRVRFQKPFLKYGLGLNTWWLEEKGPQ